MFKNTVQPTKPSPQSFAIIKIITRHAHTLEALTATGVDFLDPTMLHTGYANGINLTHTLTASENLIEQFMTLLAKANHLVNEHDTAITDNNTATTELTQLRIELSQTLAITSATDGNNQADSLPTSHKGQTNPQKFSREGHNKLWSFMTLLYICLIDHPREFPNM
jgi:regulator of replication initiation timing